MTLHQLQRNNLSKFKKEHQFEDRIAKRTKLIALHQGNHRFCYVVLEYSEPISGKSYELMCINGLLKLVHLKGYIVNKRKKTGYNSSITIESNGRILDLNSNLEQITKNNQDSDGFLYLFVRSQNAF